jgi:hypothetical protein
MRRQPRRVSTATESTNAIRPVGDKSALAAGSGSKINFMKKILCILLALLCLQTVAAPDETPAGHKARMKWWREARFGMFVHYGPVTLIGQKISWSRANSNPRCPNKGPTPAEVYDNLYKEFNPVKFNATDWAGVAKSAGMKYVVLTAKHCDGFLLWDSKVDAL